ncbi:hypothetical protein FXB42_11945 [Acetobacterium wieringae]|uniref:Reverse transcriptase domain-containing protein n=1 Tax=Acetobacterium wieringae TaxID=52694 RepID=A0A5D0WK77_9FIRM|nr:reverse transcriptase domain-containing protein [Acetobacterium wieringae]TYC84473.1 hypothetical protein FXB42_11945 [Acetobacterium wieringae]
MDYILADKLKITRPFVFLCGPNYERNKIADRRNILRENIHRIYKMQGQEVLPLIVDPFLAGKYIDFNKYSVQLLEEICAAVSCQTHILLDTMSVATELGIFANSTYSNELCVYIPKNSDVFNQGNVGTFVREVVLKNPAANIRYFEYRPRIIRRAYSSVFTAEHYAFNNDRIPKNIKEVLKEDAKGNKLICDLPIIYDDSTSIPSEVNHIAYTYKNSKLDINISIKLLFYIVTSIFQQEYPEITKGKIDDLTQAQLHNICTYTENAIINSVSFFLGIDRKSLTETHISTILKIDNKDAIQHIAKFILIYYTKSQFKFMELITSSEYTAIKMKIGEHPDVIFNLSKDQMQVVNFVVKNPELCYECVNLKLGKKVREIIKYAKSEEGDNAKKLHQSMNEMFREEYKHSIYSYAYHQGSSIRKCVDCHINSRSFVKMDIKNFFNCISKDILLKKIENDQNIDKRYEHLLNDIISSIYYNEKLPLGLVMSPIISDYYLFEFDGQVGKYCESKALIYTRYADDIMISSSSTIEEQLYMEIMDFVSNLLNRLNLKLNKDKCESVHFDKNQSFIRYIGINIVKGENGALNYLSVGKKYIYALAKDYLKYDNFCSALENITSEEKEKMQTNVFYMRTELIGKISFIRQIEGERGIERLKVRLCKYYPDIDLKAL